MIYDLKMRVLVLIALLFVFTAGSYVDMAHASVGDRSYAHHQVDHDNRADHEPCHSSHDQSHDENGCNGCCCIHSHSMATAITTIKISFDLNKHIIIASADHPYSASPSGLKRPPRS